MDDSAVSNLSHEEVPAEAPASPQAETPAPAVTASQEVEVREWIESLDAVIQDQGPDAARIILERLQAHASVAGVNLPFSANTPYANTIPLSQQPLFPGDQE